MSSSIVFALQKVVIACHVSAWNYVTKGNKVVAKSVVFCVLLSSIVGSSVYYLLYLELTVPILLLMAFLGDMCAMFKAMFLSCMLRFSLSENLCKRNRGTRTDSELLRSAVLVQFGIRVRSIPIWFLVLMLFNTRTDIKPIEIFGLALFFFLQHTLKAAAIVGLVLKGKDPPKKKKEEKFGFSNLAAGNA